MLRLLGKENFHIVDIFNFESRLRRCNSRSSKKLERRTKHLVLLCESYGAGPFMVATKIKGMVAAGFLMNVRLRLDTTTPRFTMGVSTRWLMNWLNIAKGFL